MAITAAFFRAELTEAPISALLSMMNFNSGKSSWRARPIASASLPTACSDFLARTISMFSWGTCCNSKSLKPR